VVVLQFYHKTCTNLGGQKRGRGSSNFEDVISAGDIRVTKTGRKKSLKAPFFVLRVLFLQVS
jgi:hypothetical protein